MPDQPLLSICIPTRDRVELLACCLAELAPVLALLPFPVEVLVSDNASGPEVGALVARVVDRGDFAGRLRYVRHETALGVVESYFAAMRLARGLYAHYLADDDALEPEGLIAAVRWMEREPAMVACFAPQTNVEAGSDLPVGMENDLLERPAILARGDFVGLTDIIARKQFHPEVPLVRAEAFRRHVTSPRRIFFGFWLIKCLLDAGNVGIGTHAYYVHRQRGIGGKNPQMQYQFALDRMDEHRLGLELLYLRAMRQGAQQRLVPEQRLKLADWFAQRMSGYAAIAARIAFAGGDHQAGAEFLARSALWRGGELDAYEAETLDSRVASEIAHRAATMGGEIRIVETAVARAAQIDQGFEAAAIVAREDLARALAILPPPDRGALAA